MPTDERPLSERLLAWAEYHRHYEPDREEGTVRDRALTQKEADLREAARLLASFEQPEAAELLAEAEACEQHNPESPHYECAKGRADDLRAYAQALVELAGAREKLKRVEGLPAELYRDGHCMHDVGKCNCGWGMGDAAKRLEAVLSGAGETDAEVSSRRTGAVERELGNVVSHMGGEFSLDSLKSALSGAGGVSSAETGRGSLGA